VAFRQHDVRELQPSLASLGLSSLGRVERSVLYSLHSVLKVLHHLVHHSWTLPPGSEDVLNRREGGRLLERRTDLLLGRAEGARLTRIIVTAPAEAAERPELVEELLRSGMDVLRINCAHDGPEVWSRMIGHLDSARRRLGRDCRVLMDLAGPKIRTSEGPRGPGVVKWKPVRDELGRVRRPARIWLSSEGTPAPPGVDASLRVESGFLPLLKVGDRVRFRDAREAARCLKIVGLAEKGCLAEAAHTTYVTGDTVLRGPRGIVGTVAGMELRPTAIVLRKGDRLRLARTPVPAGDLPAFGCSLPEVFRDARAGEPIWFDDGAIGGVIREAGPEGLEVEITHARPGGSKLAEDKGINLPATALEVPPLTEKDKEDLAFVARHADLVGYSFVQDPRDLRDLAKEFGKQGGRTPGLVLKIETRRAFENLPRLLLAGLRWPSVGVMIARGDLAVEAGFERLAELQEEILWFCEAAHVPVIWATQVLEHLAKDGRPSRAEVTDAAMAVRAEAVMLNKGPHVPDAVRALDGILVRMEAHQSKKTSL
jgi:pyruvate kinase